MNEKAITATVPLHEAYAEEMRVHALALISLGFARLNPAALCEAEEPDITGELVRHIKLVQADFDAPPWVDHYEVNEQQPQNVDDKLGKYRPIMDIEVERHSRGARPRLGFEAKRLGRGVGASDYFGGEGMKAFLSGYYPTTHGESGMLGYTQEGDGTNWGSRLAARSAQADCRVVAGGEWRMLDLRGIPHAFSSTHGDEQGNRLFVIHLLLPFLPAAPGN